MFVIDIEGRGPSPSRNGIVSIGVCVGSAHQPEILERKRFDLRPFPEQSMDPKCKAEFWDKQGNLLETLSVNAVPPEEGIVQFRKYLDHWHDLVPNLYVLCDTPVYDFGFINAYLDRCNLQLLQFKANGTFIPLHDADSYGRGYLYQTPDAQWMDNKQLAQYIGGVTFPSLTKHMPEDDAEEIYWLHCSVVNKA